jgi:hypothetical protein
MKRFGVLLTWALLGSVILGCGGSREPGSPPVHPPSSQTVEFKALMKKTGNKMMRGQARRSGAGAKAKRPPS